jgi:hypothetical protein
MGKSGLVNMRRRVVISPLSFTDNSGVRYFNRAWLRKATDIVGQGREYKVVRRDLQQVSSLILAMVGQPPPYLLYHLACPAGK